LYSSPNISGKIKYRSKRCARQVVHIGYAYKHQQISGRDHFEGLHTDGKIEIMRILQKKRVCGLDSVAQYLD
jgi:hypothetical protein